MEAGIIWRGRSGTLGAAGLLAEPITAFLARRMQGTKPHLRTTAVFPGLLEDGAGKNPKNAKKILEKAMKTAGDLHTNTPGWMWAPSPACYHEKV